MMRLLLILLTSLILFACATTRQAGLSGTQSPLRLQAEQDIRFLASDAMRGRYTGSPELERAAEYIENAFRAAGISRVESQTVPLVLLEAVKAAEFQLATQRYKLQQDLLVLGGPEATITAPVVFAGYGSEEEIAQLDLSGKIVVTNAGSEEETNPQLFYAQAFEKQQRLAAAGAVALIELFRSKQVRWPQLYGYLGGEGIKLVDQPNSSTIPLLWLHDPQAETFELVKSVVGAGATLRVVPGQRTALPARNVIGIVPGTDPSLQQEYVVVSAHYDHVGVGRAVNGDSIYNGARDNAMGTAAMLAAARAVAEQPASRSVIFLALTAEEVGLLGSEYYAEHPLVPLQQTVYNLNFDGAGYDDTTFVVMNGYGRTQAQPLLDAAIAASGIQPKPDPIPERNLYRFSDNWNFAKRGMPAINLAPGFSGFSESLMKYYHQPPDEPDALDYDYVAAYVKAAVAATRALANAGNSLYWTEGDELQAAGDKLYER